MLGEMGRESSDADRATVDKYASDRLRTHKASGGTTYKPVWPRKTGLSQGWVWESIKGARSGLQLVAIHPHASAWLQGRMHGVASQGRIRPPEWLGRGAPR